MDIACGSSHGNDAAMAASQRGSPFSVNARGDARGLRAHRRHGRTTGVEPLVQHRHQRRIGGGVADLGAIAKFAVMDGDLAGPDLLQLRQSGHGLAVYPGRRGEVARLEPCGDLAQVAAHQAQLFLVLRILDQHLLQAAIAVLGKEVAGGREFEGHDLGTARGDFRLAFRRRRHRRSDGGWRRQPGAQGKQQHGQGSVLHG